MLGSHQMSRDAGYHAGAARVELEMLAGFALRGNGSTIVVPPAAERLVAYLALHERPVQRSQLASALWTDGDDQRSAANLRSALWRLRAIGPAVVTATPGQLSIGPAVHVDARESVELVRSIMDGALPAEHTHMLRWLSADLLPGWYDPWLILWQERWRQLRLHALEILAQRLAAAGCYGQAVEAALAAVRGEPLRESAHRCLISVHLVEGNRIEAVRAYHRLAALLRQELGVAPSADLTRTMADLAGDAPATPTW